MSSYIYIQGVSEIGGQTLRAYSTCCKDEKKSYKHGFGNASFTSYNDFLLILKKWADIHYMYGRANGNCRKAQRFYEEIFPQRRCPSKIPLVRTIADFGKQDFSYLMQLIEDETET